MRIHHSTVTPPQEAPVAAPSPAHPSIHARVRPPICCPTCGAMLRRLVTPTADDPDNPVAIAPYDVEAFADLVCTDPARAAAHLAALSASAQLRQALAYVAWLEQWGITIGLDAVLAAWSVLLTEQAPDTSRTTPMPR